ncbi:hypothetical protein [Halarcobacter bivalviorum]|uniref:hypothetical protein n=1 Tax=Halarcobacter bivalviorum TaxID=663364 RepID=UPI00100C2C3A|nr:hypothetical protein [Halarcobacter bivalviorum]RXK07091.1 hypothetical protein CRU97_02995 [Halarcobacter bivalviorum]
MFKNFFFIIFLSLFFVSFLEASNEKINQQIYELKTSQDYAKKINDEKITLIMGQIIQKENEIKELEKELKNYVNKEDLQREINYQNNRIEDINSSVDRLSIIVSISIGLFGILITGIVIFFAFRFERIARVQADKEVKSWIDEKADKEFKPKVDSYLAQIDGRAKKLFEKNEGLTEVLEDKIKSLDKYTEEEKKELEEEAEEIKSSKNESDYTFEDKYKLFVSKYVNENYKEALEDLNILEKEDLNDNNLLKVLWAKATTLEQMKEEESAIKVYDEIINKLDNTSNLKEYAIALGCKGNILGKNKKYQEAIELYSMIVNKLRNSTRPDILKHVTHGLISKFETNMIINKKNSKKDLDLYYKLVEDKKSELIVYKMLALLEKAKDSEVDEELISWKEEFKDILIEDWSFTELKTWANSFEDKEVKERLLRYIDIFEKHNESVEEN